MCVCVCLCVRVFVCVCGANICFCVCVFVCVCGANTCIICTLIGAAPVGEDGVEVEGGGGPYKVVCANYSGGSVACFATAHDGRYVTWCCKVLQGVAGCCSMLQCVVLCCSVL